MSPAELHTAIQKGTVELKDGYYVGETNSESVYLSEAEGKELLSSYADGGKAKRAVQLAQASEDKNQTGLFSSLSAYVTKLVSTEEAEPVSETPVVDGPVCSEPANPFDDYETDQSVDPNTEYGREIIARKIKAHKYAKEHCDQLTDEQKERAALHAGTAADETAYAPEVLKDLLQGGDVETVEAALEFAQDVISGVIEGAVNEVTEEDKGTFAKTTHEFLESDEAKAVDPELAKEAHDTVEHYYQEHPEVAEEHDFDVDHDTGDHIGQPFQPMSDSGETLADADTETHGAMGAQGLGENGADAPHFDPQQLAADAAVIQGFDPIAHTDSDDTHVAMATSSAVETDYTVSDYGPDMNVENFSAYDDMGAMTVESDPFYDFSSKLAALFLSDEVGAVAEQSVREGLTSYYQGKPSQLFQNNQTGIDAAENNTAVPGVAGGIAVYETPSREVASHQNTVTAASKRAADRRFEEQLAAIESVGGVMLGSGDMFDLGSEKQVDAASIAEARAQDPLLVGLASLAAAVGVVKVGPKLAVLNPSVLAALSKAEGQAPVVGTSQRGNPSDHGSSKGRGDRDGDSGEHDSQQSQQYADNTADFSDDDEIDQRQVA